MTVIGSGSAAAAGGVRFRAMGCDAHVVVTGPPDNAAVYLDAARRRIDALEQKWSRFIADSEISRLNMMPMVPVLVSSETVALVEHALVASEFTRGFFDPTVADSVVDLGYDRTFDAVRDGQAPVVAPHAAPGTAGIVVDTTVGTVTLPAGVHFDPGGIGKGFAADLVCQELIAAGAPGAMINLGGDLRIAGLPPDENGWIVGVEDPHEPGRHVARVTVVDGAVCTSSRLRRSWHRADGQSVHHLVDPATGEPFATDVVAVTVVAGEAWWAEALTKAVFGDALHVVENASVLIIYADRSLQVIGPDVFAA